MLFRVPSTGCIVKPSSRELAGLVAGAVGLTAASAFAAPVGAPDAASSRGAPIAQTFLDDHGDNVSLVATPQGVSCIASRALPIRETLYRGADDVPVLFRDITRSPAASVQAIARPGAAASFRLQLKYTVDPAYPITLEVGTRSLDLAPMVETSRDSLWLRGSAAEALAAGFADGDIPMLHARSAETGRQITDRIDAPAMDGLETCLETLETLEMAAAEAAEAQGESAIPGNAASDVRTGEAAFAQAGDDAPEITVVDEPPAGPTLPIPVSGVRLELRAQQDPTLRLHEDQLQGCRMRDIPDELFLGRLTSVTGFFSQTQDVYVAFDDEGELQRAYIPGIFDSDLTEGSNTARLSLAADSNLPDQPNTVRGCLGDARLQAPICVYPGEGDDDYVLAECGVLGVSDDRDEGFAWPMAWATVPSGSSVSSGTFLSTPASAAMRAAASPRFGGPGLPGGGSPRRPGVPPFTPEGPDGPETPPGNDSPFNPPETPEIPIIPLPAALWLLLGALASLPGLRWSQRRRLRT